MGKPNTKQNVEDRAKMLKSLMMDSSSSDEAKSPAASPKPENAPDVDKLRGMYRKRDKNVGERTGAPSTEHKGERSESVLSAGIASLKNARGSERHSKRSVGSERQASKQ